MNTLPKELEDIIYHYSHHLKMNDVMNEMEENLYWCCNCGTHTHENIIPTWKHCVACEEPICFDCNGELKDTEDEECDDCFFTGMIYSNIEQITNHNLTDDEFDTLTNLFAGFHINAKEIMCDFIYIEFEDVIHNKDICLSFDLLYEYMVQFIHDENLDDY